MATVEELTRSASVRGILSDGLVTVADIAWYGSNCVELTLEIATAGRPWSFDDDGASMSPIGWAA